MSSPEGVTILAAAVLDDVLGIILLAVVVGIGKVAAHGGHVSWGAVGGIALKAILFWLVCTVVGIFVAPYLTRKLKWFESMEVIAMFCLGLGLLLAGLSELVHLAMIIGAYVMGLALSQTDMAEDIRKKLEGLYGFIVPIFFCVMGMMVDFSVLPGVALFGGLYALLAIVGKIVGCGLPAVLSGFNMKGAFRIGAGMLPRGEVTLIIAGNGLIHGLIGKDMFGVAIMTLLVASLVAPPVLVTSFRGGKGYKKTLKKESEEKLFSLEIPLPTPQLADFIKTEFIRTFKNEDYFVRRVHPENDIYAIRKDKHYITLLRENNRVTLSTPPENENMARLVSSEVLLHLKEILKGTDSVLNDKTESEILGDLFNE
jgi:Kef-type K+ transport system membrane component KefB